MKIQKNASHRASGNIDQVNASVKKESIKRENIQESQSRSNGENQSIRSQPVQHEENLLIKLLNLKQLKRLRMA